MEFRLHMQIVWHGCISSRPWSHSVYAVVRNCDPLLHLANCAEPTRTPLLATLASAAFLRRITRPQAMFARD